MRPAREGDIPVRVKNSYNPKAPGTLITKTRDMSKVCRVVSCRIDDIYYSLKDDFRQSFPHLFLQALLTSIVLKRNISMLDIVSTRMLGQFGFLAKVRMLIAFKPVLLVVESIPVFTIPYLCRCFQSLKI